MNVGAELLAGSGDRALCKAVHTLRLRRPDHSIVLYVPLPRAKTAGLERKHELGLALAQSCIAHGCSVTRAYRLGEQSRALDRERGAACEHLHARDVARAEEVTGLRRHERDGADR